ncbi:MAG TPA: amino acid transporter [Chloroflexota bacterium]|nr:amino acid transporter [Chloroflexota bacterium]
MAAPPATQEQPPSALARWLLRDQPREPAGPHEVPGRHRQHPWWRVMCLTGVDYFSTLGYQPGIAFLAAGLLAPVATLVLVLLTLFGALPVYRRVARESPHGEGSIAMLERLLPWWGGKLFVLVLLGFVATDFVITITLSAADATAHILENPFAPAALHGQQVPVTLLLVAVLGAVFLRGFGEAIGIAVVLVAVYLLLNLVVCATGLLHLAEQPAVVVDWRQALLGAYGDPGRMVLAALLVFPRLALGLSGFETGAAVMPLVQGHPGETEAAPRGRIRNTHRLLTTAALIMSGYLIISSLSTTLLIPPEAFQPGGEANGRALAYLAHEFLGDGFGTAYDLSTILILWFAGASAMAGLLNIVPRYLPRYGMAPEWTRATRPLVLVFTAVAFVVTLIFRADVDAQGGAYATGVLVLITSASIAVTLAARRAGQRRLTAAFFAIALAFVYTTLVNVHERPDGVKIAAVFIAAVVVVSLVSRAARATELRAPAVVLDATARRFVAEAAAQGPVRFIANEPNARDTLEYTLKEWEEREATHIPAESPVLFLEVTVRDPSEFAPVVEVAGEAVGGFRVLRAAGASIPNAIAAVLLHVRDATGVRPHAYFNWSEYPPVVAAARYLLFGEGDVAPVTREVLRHTERDPERRPAVHVG